MSGTNISAEKDITWNSWGGPFCVLGTLRYRKVLYLRELLGVSRFPEKNFCLTVPRNFRKGTSWCLLVLAWACYRLLAWIIQYNADLPLTFASAQASSKSDIIPARSFALLSHRLVRLQLTSPLAYIIAQLFEPCLFQLCRHITTYTRLKNTTTNYVDILQHTHTRDWKNYVNITEYVYLFYSLSLSLFLFCLLWPSGICNIDEVKACRSVWGSLLNTYPRSLSHHAQKLYGGTVWILQSLKNAEMIWWETLPGMLTRIC